MIDIQNLKKSLLTLEKAYSLINTVQKDSIEYEMYRNSLIKGFEMTLEQAGKLLKKKITPFFASKRNADVLSFKDVFRNANKFSLISDDEAQRWFQYRDNRNNTAHDYGEIFANETLTLIDSFIKDVRKLMDIIENG